MIIPIYCFVQADILRPINAGYFTQALITFSSKAVIQTNESINCACFWCNHCNLKKASVIPQSKGLCSSTALNRYSSPTQNKTVEGPFTERLRKENFSLAFTSLLTTNRVFHKFCAIQECHYHQLCFSCVIRNEQDQQSLES